MKLTKRKILLTIAIFAMAFAIISVHKWSREHVDYITASQNHPLNCVPCHVQTRKDGLLGKLMDKQYISPYNLAISPDNKLLFATGQEADALFIINIPDQKIITKIDVGDRPHSVVVSRNGRKAYVSNQWSNNISVIDIEKREEAGIIATGGGPAGLALGPDDRMLYVANTYTSDVSVIDLSQNREIKRLMAGNYATGMNTSPDGKYVYVVSQRSVPVEYRTPPKTEITIIETQSNRVVERKYVEEAHIMENINFSPSGDMAFTTMVRPKNLVPAVQIENGWMINFALGIIIPGTDNIYQLPLDDPNDFYADPYDVCITPEGDKAFVSHSGADHISVVDIKKLKAVIEEIDDRSIQNASNDLELSQSYIVKRIKTGANPKGMSISPDGKYLYFAERLSDKIGIINTHSLMLESHITLDNDDQQAMLRKGEQLFNNAGHTFQNQYSCYTCHPDSHEDGLTYDMAYYPGEDLTNVQTLRGLANTSPFKWNGKNVSIYMQCGMRFSKFVTRTESFDPNELDALVGYITRQIEHPPNLYRNESDVLTEAQKRGKAIFYRTKTNTGEVIPQENRCITCHPPPNFTNRHIANVGTATERDHQKAFDAPNLNNVYESAPYLHDGRANTLEELWTKYNPHDEHGIANDMTKDQLNDLVEYLRTLGKAEYYK